ncbi:hypothetical protein [Reichenbachiella sp.]|uniref:hypothetical protein n=1 Tax=Reichenbachiella sp. TaxID=2184521 RepID=UPI003B5AEEA3
MNFCRFCQNSKIDLHQGVICILQKLPEISTEGCPKFQVNKKKLTDTYNLHKAAKNHERKEIKKGIKHLLLWLIPAVVVGIYGIYKSYTLSHHFRYTVAKVTLTKQSGWTQNILWFGGITKEFEYKYRLNHKYYRVQSKFSNEAEPGLPSKFLIKYDPNDPSISEVVREFNVENFPLKKHPVNGIAPDSIDIFLSNYEPH